MPALAHGAGRSLQTTASCTARAVEESLLDPLTRGSINGGPVLGDGEGKGAPHQYESLTRGGLDADKGDDPPAEERTTGGTVGSLVKAVWRLCTVLLLLSLVGLVDGDIWMPFLYSRVRCCDSNSTMLPASYDIVDPKAINQTYHMNVSRILACEVPELPRRSTQVRMTPHL